MTGWVLAAAGMVIFGFYTITVFLLGLIFSDRFKIEIEKEAADDVS